MKDKKNKILKLASLSVIVAFAMILSYIESRIPVLVPVPGIKIGLANIAVIFTLYKFGVKEAIAVSFARVILLSTLFGSPISFIYSFTGATVSLCLMAIFKRFTPFSVVTVSVIGGVMHNIGQIFAAAIMLSTNVIVYYLPFLLLSGTIAGVAVGTASVLLIKRINLKF